MVQVNDTYTVVRTLPRKGEAYAVTDRVTGITVLRIADRNFRRDKRRVFVKLTGTDAA